MGDEVTLVCGCPESWPRNPGGRLWGWHHFSGKCEGAAPAPLGPVVGGWGGGQHQPPCHVTPQGEGMSRCPGPVPPASRPIPLLSLVPPALACDSWGAWKEGWAWGVPDADTLACCPRTSGTRWAMCPWSGTMTSPTWAMIWMAGASTSPCGPVTSWTSFWTRWTTLITGKQAGMGPVGAGRGGFELASDGRPAPQAHGAGPDDRA